MPPYYLSYIQIYKYPNKEMWSSDTVTIAVVSAHKKYEKMSSEPDPDDEKKPW